MNERIKELAELAGFRSDVTVSDGQNNHIITKTEQALDKFASLIIQECAGLFPAEYDDVEGKTTIGKIIKNHFGLK